MGLPSKTRAVVTGAASGLGRALALEVARRGGEALLADVDEERLAETVFHVEKAGGRSWPFACDVRELRQVEAMAAEAERRMGGVDLLANNAGVAGGGDMGELPLEDWRWVMDVNLWGVIHGCHVFVPRMRDQRRGFLLNVASIAGLVSPPGTMPYNVSKAAVVSLSESLHAEEYKNGIGVTVLCPSFFQSSIVKSGRGKDELGKQRMEEAMRRSKVQAPDVARAALDALDRGELYCLPMGDARFFWRLKRAVPGRFPEVARFVVDKVFRS